MVLDFKNYMNNQSLYYKFRKISRNDDPAIRFEFGCNPVHYITVNILDEKEHQNLNSWSAKSLSVEILSEFLDKLDNIWIHFLTDEMNLLRSHLRDLATLDFCDTEEKFIDGKINELENDPPINLIDKYLKDILSKYTRFDKKSAK